MEKLHCIHSRNGRIGDGTDTTPADLDAIVAALSKDGRGHLLLYFHGGLVDKTAGLDIAERLLSRFSDSTYPIFYVWESGFVEAIRNNLHELPHEPVFKNLVRKALEYALNHIGGSNGARSINPGAVDPEKVRQAIDTYWDDPTSEHVPYRNFVPVVAGRKARSVANQIKEAEIQADLETDAQFKNALATLPSLFDNTRGSLGTSDAVVRETDFSHYVAAKVSDVRGGRGLFSWIKVALLVKRILQGILLRYAARRDHGLYATVVEEVLRGVHLGGSGLNEWGKALQWNRMKQDTLDAFSKDPDLHAGTALLERLRAAHSTGMPLSRITLVGHSTGAIYIAHWLDRAVEMLSTEISIDLILLAPAISHERFARTVTQHGNRIGRFRMFCMQDEFERDDQVIGNDSAMSSGRDWKRFIYPCSLLYLVSGILESRIGHNDALIDEPDMPLLGMERFLAWRDVYSDEEFPEVATVRAWLHAMPNSMVWAKSEGQAAGLNSMTIDHGDFDNDEDTLTSIESMLREW